MWSSNDDRLHLKVSRLHASLDFNVRRHGVVCWNMSRHNFDMSSVDVAIFVHISGGPTRVFELFYAGAKRLARFDVCLFSLSIHRPHDAQRSYLKNPVRYV